MARLGKVPVVAIVLSQFRCLCGFREVYDQFDVGSDSADVKEFTEDEVTDDSKIEDDDCRSPKNPGCNHLAGKCCPHGDGTMLACCSQDSPTPSHPDMLDPKEYPTCTKALHEANLQPNLEDLYFTSEEQALIAPPAWHGGTREESRQHYGSELLRTYFLRKALVGQPDPRGPTLYTPEAQLAVVKAFDDVMEYMRKHGITNLDTNVTTKIFQQINVEDKGTWLTSVINSFAWLFNRGSADTVFRSKSVTTRPYDLRTWGENVPAKVKEYNTLTYLDKKNKQLKALQLKKWFFGLFHKTSFKYTFPPKGIEYELNNILSKIQIQKDHSVLQIIIMAEAFVRDSVILHPYTDSNGRTARVALSITLMMHGLPPIFMARQDDDMTSSPAELRDRLCEAMVQAKMLLRTLPEKSAAAMGSSEAHCCSGIAKLEKNHRLCVMLPGNVSCELYSEYTQSKRYLDWTENADLKQCFVSRNIAERCKDGSH